MKRITVGLLAAAAVIASLTGCSGGSGSTGSAGSAGVIKVGLNYELSGAVATYGSDSVDGVQMAVDAMNAKGGINGKQIQLVKYDNQSEAGQSTAMATKLMTQDKVVAVIGPATSGAFKAEIPVANSNKVPVISGSATADDATVDASGNAQPYAFRTCFSDSVQGSAMANYASQKLNAKNVVIIKDNSSDYAKGLASNFTTQFKNNGGTIVDEESYVAGDTDFNAILTRIKPMGFDAIYLPGYYQEAGLIIKAARDMGINVPVMGADGFDSPTLLQLAGAAALNNVYFTNHYSSLDQDPAVQQFITDFKAKYNKDPNAFNALGYDTANLVMDAISRAMAATNADPTGESVHDALASTKDFPAVSGKLSIDDHHNAVKDIILIALKDGVQSSSERISA